MKIEEIAVLLNERFDCSYPDINGNWMFSFDCGEVKEGVFLAGIVGRGKTMDIARTDYINQIKGKTIVFHAMTDHRKEITIPETVD